MSSICCFECNDYIGNYYIFIDIYMKMSAKQYSANVNNYLTFNKDGAFIRNDIPYLKDLFDKLQLKECCRMHCMANCDFVDIMNKK